jgi:hypothetical protein
MGVVGPMAHPSSLGAGASMAVVAPAATTDQADLLCSLPPFPSPPHSRGSNGARVSMVGPTVWADTSCTGWTTGSTTGSF